ncbi:unnamed protein product [Effrenium voratum]|nr:unnamed protein product [Effrenium voratum]
MKHEDHVRYCGLDHAMLLEFCSMCNRILVKIMIPLIFIMGPLNFFFGKGEAEETGDNLSRIAMGNVKTNHPWLYYIYGLIPIFVVWVVRREIWISMRLYCRSRADWLKTLKNPQASAVMVEGIPEEYQSDEKVYDYFTRLFGKDSVKRVHVCKNVTELETVYQELRDATMALAKAQQEWENLGKGEERPMVKPSVMSDPVDAIQHWQEQVELKTKETKEYRENFERDAKAGVGGVNSHSGFLTFKDARNARVAVSMKMCADRTQWLVSQPPPPTDIIWSDMKVNVDVRGVKRTIGLALVFGLYVAFTPFCVFITNLATAIDLGPFQSLWAAYAPTLGLMIFLAFAPTVLINIFSVLFHFKSQVWVQLQLQTWYWFFLVFFVILVTVIGQGFTQFVSKLADDPLSFPLLLADKMPASTHYYLNFLGLQWVTHAMNLTRYIQCMKFVGLSKIWNDDDARALAEPEDQDYYGMGSRSARFTTNMMVAIIFGTISPLMSFLAWVNFFLCRVFYGYLMIWAESKKQDSGGYFFVAQLHHVFVGLLTYALLMTGMMLRRAPDYVPAGMSILGLVYAVVAYNSFRNDFEWEVLPWEEISQDADGKDFVPEDSGEKYIQPELLDELPTTKLS